MSRRRPKVSGSVFTLISTGSYVIGIDEDRILFGKEALRIASQYLRNRIHIPCSICGGPVTLDTLGLLKVVNGKPIIVLCRECVLEQVDLIGEMIEKICC
ncbi:MAG: hypothetical protein GXO23_04105 [Crenarchaeota archaeon]|nr:hypothetical protein [Thermoproteota archaeon]